MTREITEIKIDEYGDETHESWLLIGAHKISTTQRRLFDSEINHQHFIRVHVSRVSRKRDLKRDWLHGTTLLMEFDLSEAQWGAFVSSFGSGSGVPATLVFHDGQVPSAPFESRLAESIDEVRRATEEGVADIQDSFKAVEEAFERKAGRRELGELIHDLHHKVKNAPANMEFTANSLTEHAENVVTKAKADIEAMVKNAQIGLEAGDSTTLLGSGTEK